MLIVFNIFILSDLHRFYMHRIKDTIKRIPKCFYFGRGEKNSIKTNALC